MQFNNRGILFRNFRKRQEKHPDFTGSATIAGKKYKIAAWTKKGKTEFQSLAFTEETPSPPEENDSEPDSIPDVSPTVEERIPF